MPKLSEFTHTANLLDGDIVPIIQNGSNLRTNLAALKAFFTSGLAGGGGAAGGVRVEDFAGADDNAKFLTAHAWIRDRAFKPPLLFLENRDYGPFTTKVDVYSGFKIIGSESFGNQHRAANTQAQRILINMGALGGAWLNLPNGTAPTATAGADYKDTYDVEITRLSFYSQSSTTDFFAGAEYGVLWTSVIRDVGFSLFRHVIGSIDVRMLMTACLWDGWWNINNARSVSIHIGGSDNVLWVGSNCLIDSPVAPTNYAQNVPYHIWLDYLSKTTIGHVFITAETRPAAVRITGSGNTPALILQGGRFEGRNGSKSSYGAVIRIEGGRVTLRDTWTAYGMSAPASSQRTNEGGVITVLGGRVLIDGAHYGRAGTDGVADTVPFIYASGASTRVRIANAETSDIGGTFTTTGLPHVRAVNGATIRKDDSVTQVA